MMFPAFPEAVVLVLIKPPEATFKFWVVMVTSPGLPDNKFTLPIVLDISLPSKSVGIAPEISTESFWHS